MDPQVTPPTTDTAVDEQAVNTAIRFLTTLFVPGDLMVIRPVETWTEAGKKRSQVDYKGVRDSRCALKNLQSQWQWLTSLLTGFVKTQIDRAKVTRCNVFFGVCPRFRGNGEFELAWQIRTVRALWCDIDHVSVEEALDRCANRGVPRPSVSVNSGNGAHLYWLLTEAIAIDDIGDPLPVRIDWTELSGGRKKRRRYILDGADKIYLDQRRRVGKLSPKAQHVQDVISGIAAKLGGDHTHDLARLLRLPGTLNRKNEVNGDAPKPTVLVECEPSRRYAFADFEVFATAAPQRERRNQIAAMPLPVTRKLCPSKADVLSERIAACTIAPPGTRSEADFALCCFALRNGIPKDEVWSRVESVGKFAEDGQRYFDRTWDNAEHEVRADLLDRLQKKGGASKGMPVPPSNHASKESEAHDVRDSDGGQSAGEEDNDRTLRITPAITEVSTVMRGISDRLLKAGNCFIRADQLVLVNGAALSPILSSKELGGLLNQYVEFWFATSESGEYKPLPTNYGDTWLNHPVERARFPKIKLFTHNPVYTLDWRLAQSGYDQQSGIYYAGPPIEPSEDAEHLDRLLQDFCFKSPADRTNYLGMLLTVLLVPHFIGSKPAALFNGNQPGLGKSILAQIIAILRDDAPAETATYNPNDEEFEKRLGAIVRRGATTIIIDNAKGRGRNARIDSPCLERSITDAILSFRLLGHSREIRAENSHIFCVTANAPDVSRDLVSRSVVINLQYEGNPTKRTFSIEDPEGYAEKYRLEILGELIGMVERWIASGRPMASVASRFNKRGWGKIVGGILHSSGQPDFLDNAEAAATQLDDTRRDFAELVVILADNPQGSWTAGELGEVAGKHELLSSELGDGSARSRATRMGILVGRYVRERFELPRGGDAVFLRAVSRNGNVYRVEIIENVRNDGASAEPLRNVGWEQGSAA